MPQRVPTDRTAVSAQDQYGESCVGEPRTCEGPPISLVPLLGEMWDGLL